MRSIDTLPSIDTLSGIDTLRGIQRDAKFLQGLERPDALQESKLSVG